jgi:NAD-dependent dihydropyrimidine dehydrogenase PreA subunit
MAYKITDDCVACGACMGSCPSDAIKEGEKYTIDADACIDCGSCVDTCPSGAIVEA